MSQESSKSDSTHKPYPEVESPSTGKVADAAAAYTVRPTVPHLRTSARTIAGISASDEVWRFAVKNELIPHLETAVQLVRKIFQTVVEMRFTYDIDPEIKNESYVTIWAKVKGTLDNLLRGDWAYTEAIIQAIPKDKRSFIHLFPIVV